MKPKRITLVSVALVALAAVALGALAEAPTTTAMPSALPTGNLVQNPGAEDGTHVAAFADSHPGYRDDDPPGWFGPSNISLITYDFDEAIGVDERKKIESDLGSDLGDAFFAGGPATTDQSMPQLISIRDPSIQAAIDAGTVQAKVSALIGGYGKEGDNGEVRFNFMQEPKVLGKVVLGPVTAEDRKGETTLLPRSETVDVPKGTRLIQILLVAHFVTGVFVDAYFDNISLELVSKSSAPPPPTPGTPAPSAPTPSAPTPSAPTATTPTPSAPTPSPTPSTTPGTATPVGSPSPAQKSAKPALTLVCAGKTLIATLKPVKGSKTSSVWFYINGKVRAKDGRAPFIAAIPTKGLGLPLTINTATQAAGKTTFIRKQVRGC